MKNTPIIPPIYPYIMYIHIHLYITSISIKTRLVLPLLGVSQSFRCYTYSQNQTIDGLELTPIALDSLFTSSDS